MKIENILSLLIMVCLFLSCSNKDQSGMNTNIIEIDVIEASKDVRDFKLSNIVRDIEIIELESIVESFFRNSRSLTIGEKYICSSCDHEERVLLFSRNGKFLRIIGSVGKGPGEYEDPWFTVMDPNEKFIIVCDYIKKKIIKYSIDGKFIKEKKIINENPTMIDDQPVFIDDKHFAVRVRRPNKPMDDFNSVYIYDLDLNLIDKMVHRSNNDQLILPRLFYANLESGFDGHYFWEAYTDTLYYIDINKDPRPQYHFLLDKKQAPLDYYKGKLQAPGINDYYKIGGVTDIKDYLIAWTILDKPYNIVYDKRKKESFSVSSPFECINTSNTWFTHGWDNDVFGIDGVWLSKYNKENNYVITILYLERFVDNGDLQCIRDKKVKMPEKRDQIVEMIENSTGEELPLIVLMYLK